MHVSATYRPRRAIYVYAIDNAGTVELAVSSTLLDQGSLQTTTAEGGAGAADSRFVLYSTTARSNVPIRLIGRIKSSQATAGNSPPDKTKSPKLICLSTWVSMNRWSTPS